MTLSFTVCTEGVDESLPLIYMWEIQSADGALIGRYVGKAKAGAERPLNHYARNVQNILTGKAYRKSNPGGFRRVHHALARATIDGHSVCLTFLCNVGPGENINSRERELILANRCNGPNSWQLNG